PGRGEHAAGKAEPGSERGDRPGAPLRVQRAAVIGEASANRQAAKGSGIVELDLAARAARAAAAATSRSPCASAADDAIAIDRREPGRAVGAVRQNETAGGGPGDAARDELRPCASGERKKRRERGSEENPHGIKPPCSRRRV